MSGQIIESLLIRCNDLASRMKLDIAGTVIFDKTGESISYVKQAWLCKKSYITVNIDVS